MKTVFTIILVLFLTITGFTQNSEKYLFVGGMFYGSGYYQLKNNYQTTQSFSNCLGGRLSYFVSPKFLLGGMGNSVTVKYNSPSYYRLGSGGIIGEYILTPDPFYVSIGIFMGGGRLKNFHAISSVNNQYLMEYNTDSYAFISPVISLTYRLTSKIGFSFIADYPFHNKNTTIQNALNLRGGITFFR